MRGTAAIRSNDADTGRVWRQIGCQRIQGFSLPENIRNKKQVFFHNKKQ